MARFNIAFDDANAGLGHYFDLSRQDIITFINQSGNGHQINEIPSTRCSQAYIDITFPTPNPDIFVFIAYSHGFADRLTSAQGSFIQKNINSNRFVNSLFYSMACHSALELGTDLHEQNCHGFIGYDSDAWVLVNHIQVSLACDNFGMKKFISGATIQQAFDDMKQKFTVEIDKLEQAGEILAATSLRETRDALVLKGNNPDLTFAQF